MQRYVGLDIHKKFLFAVVLDSDGELISEKKIKNVLTGQIISPKNLIRNSIFLRRKIQILVM